MQRSPRTLTTTISVVLSCQILATLIGTPTCASNPSEKIAADSAEKSPAQSDEIRRRLELQDRFERLVRERASNNLRDRAIQTNDKYLRAKENYDKANKNRSDVPAFVHTSIAFACASHDIRDTAKCSELYAEGVDAYLTLDKSSPAEQECRADIWSHLGYLTPDALKIKFSLVFKIYEQRTPNGPPSDLEHALSKIMSDQNSISFAQRFRGPSQEDSHSFDEKQFWKTAIEIRSSVRGANDPSLTALLERYVRICEQRGDIAEAEKSFLRLSTLQNKNSDNSEAKTQIDLARFYLRQALPDKAEAAYRRADTLAKNKMNRTLVSQFLVLATESKSRSLPGLADEIVERICDIGGDENIRAVDNHLNQIITGYLNSFQLTKAQALLVKRCAASKTCVNDTQAARWRIKLSDIDLALGEEAESNKLFKEVKISTALSNGDVDKLIEERKKLIETLKQNKQTRSSETQSTTRASQTSPSTSKQKK